MSTHKTIVEDIPSETEPSDDESLENEPLENESPEDESLEYESLEDESLEYESLEDEPLEELPEDKSLEDEAPEDESLEEESPEDDTETETQSQMRHPTNKRSHHPEATAQKRKRTIAQPPPARPKGKISTASKLPTIPEFGSFTPTSQLGEFRDWIKLVRSALRFAPDWSEQMTADWFDIICGKNLRIIISSFHLEPTDAEKPFTDLVKKLDEHFRSVTDPSLDHQALAKCKQEPGETANDFYVRLAQLVRHMRTDPEHIRTHYMLHLRDGEFRNLAITNRWSLLETVAAATRNESLRVPKAESNTSSLGTGEVAAVSEHRNRHPTRSQYAGDKSKFGLGQAGQGISRATPARSTRPDERRNPLGCRNCGIVTHRSGTCPAQGKQCINCNKWGHFKAVCPDPIKEDPKPSRSTRPAQNKPARINQVNDASDWSD